MCRSFFEFIWLDHLYDIAVKLSKRLIFGGFFHHKLAVKPKLYLHDLGLSKGRETQPNVVLCKICIDRIDRTTYRDQWNQIILGQTTDANDNSTG